MSHFKIQDRLDEFLDDTLPDGERREMEMHLAECAECRAEVEAIRSLRADARALPRGIRPPRDLWPEIRGRIEGSRTVEVDFGRRSRRSPRAARGWLAAAAAVLVVASSAVTTWVLRDGPAPLAEVVPVAAPARTPSALAAFRPAEAEYLRTTDELTAVLEARREVLDPRTVAVVESNLRIIDGAIAEARAALLADPQNRDLTEMLSGVYRQKVDLLQSAVLLPQS